MTDTARIIAAIATVWDALRDRHPELPSVTVALTTTGAPHTLLYPEETGTIYGSDEPELYIHMDTVAAGGHSVIECILHMATHALCDVRGVSATSNRGIRHNQKFAIMAELVGGHWPSGQPPHRVRGYSPVPVTDRTLEDMAAYVTALDTVIGQTDLSAVERPTSKATSRVTLRCECGRTAQMGKRVAAIAPVICGRCGKEFVES
ncbi:hypothetical protein AB0P37_08545 [Streptomyces antimycoticus]|uniref:hypothetical protein n=1 Tax=Streptomyces antimycoticus TaxID=68175 RepID=UPI00342358EC